MIQSVQIENYRGIRRGQLLGFPRIAVLTGPNGCGKSSVLEAIQLGTGVVGHQTVIDRRDSLPNPTRWLLHRGQDGVASIHLRWTDGHDFVTTLELRSTGFSMKTKDSGFPHEQRDVSFIEQRTGHPRDPLHQLFTNTRIRGGIDAARKLLNEVDPNIQGLEILTEGERPVLHIAYEDRVVPAALAGDGMESLVRLALELTQRANSTFLIEEPEAHQHSAAIQRSARIIVGAARLESQIILSTHSLELIDDLLAALAPQELDQLAVYRLRLVQGELRVQRIAGPEVNAARTEIGDDLR